MLTLLAAAALGTVSDPKPVDSLLAGFKNPPLSARPHTWWHWMNGNVTKEGITADLEAMKQVGIGGAQMFTVDQGIPAGKAGYMGPLWRELTAHAVREAHRLGIELCIHNCAGWSSSGGPWIEPGYAMQVLGWSTKVVAGGAVSETLDPIKAPQVVTAVPYARDIAVFAIKGTPTTGGGDSFLGRTGVVRQDGLSLDLSNRASLERSDILNVTDKFRDGKLTCRLPEGTWTILRLGHVPTGKDNHPAPPEGDGLEVDKLSRAALKKHWDGMMAKVISDVGPLAGKTLNNALIDSYEVGSQNWTPNFRGDFRRLRGYDPLPFMPALTGMVIDSADVTERFLWDYRRTIADLYAENYFAYFGELCHEKGMQFSTEPYGNGGFDNIQAGGTADIPMGEFWLGGAAMESTKLASSVGHVYGRPVIGAESFTADDVRGKFLEEPYMMKTVGDLAFVNGINRYIFHRYAQQPWTKHLPGMTMGPWGTHLERTQTWWGEAATWLKYVARSQYLLQKGQFVADAVVFTGETAPVDLPYARGGGRIVPEGNDYDGCDTKILMSMKVRDGKIVLPSGMTYRLLILNNSTYMTPRVARKIRSLVADGAVVVGPKPLHTPSLVGYPASESAVASIGNEVWGTKEGQQFGKGQVFATTTPADALKRLKVLPDFSFTGSRARLLHIHRKIDGADVYFVSNQRNQSAIADCTFRVDGKQPELWHPETGKTEFAPVWDDGAAKGTTRVSLRLQPAESVFVVFRNQPKGTWLSSFGAVKSSPINAPAITIQSARYGSEDGRGVDVTAKIRDLVSHGETEIEATNANFGDPVVNVIKRLTVSYKVGKVAKEAVIRENETLSLGMSGPSANVSDYDLAEDRSGETIFYRWDRGIWSGSWSNAGGIAAEFNRPIASLSLDNHWKVKFAPKLGAPDSASFSKLIPWNKSADKGIKYFSGSAVYSKSFNYKPPSEPGLKRVRLDLGEVKNFATVTLNGKTLATLWKPPYMLDVTSAIRPGKNELQIKVTNLWVNRIIGDEQLPPDVEWDGNHLKKWPDWLLNDQPRPKTGRITFTTWKFWDKNSPLLDSGLLGPVRLQTALGIRFK